MLFAVILVTVAALIGAGRCLAKLLTSGGFFAVKSLKNARFYNKQPSTRGEDQAVAEE
jgi:hypothetical protein